MDICADIDTVHCALATPEDISEAVVFLVADSGRCVSGTQLSVDAGGGGQGGQAHHFRAWRLKITWIL
jgi:hypothetical protein